MVLELVKKRLYPSCTQEKILVVLLELLKIRLQVDALKIRLQVDALKIRLQVDDENLRLQVDDHNLC